MDGSGLEEDSIVVLWSVTVVSLGVGDGSGLKDESGHKNNESSDEDNEQNSDEDGNR